MRLTFKSFPFKKKRTYCCVIVINNIGKGKNKDVLNIVNIPSTHPGKKNTLLNNIIGQWRIKTN